MRRLLPIFIALLGAAAFAVAAGATPGELDPSFGTGGKAVMNVVGTYDDVIAVAAEPDGKVLALLDNVTRYPTGLEFAVARFDGDGTLDSSFGSGGLAVTDVSGYQDKASAVLVAPDAKILVVGYSPNTGHWEIVRYTAGGSLDAGFGNNGVVIDPSSRGWLGDAALLADGSIIVTGQSEYLSSNPDVAVSKYTSNGTLDAAFGTGGSASVDVSQFDIPWALAVQPDGAVVVVGYSTPVWNGWLVRFTATGALDGSFGSGGTVVSDFGGSDYLRDVAIAPDGGIIVAGMAWPNGGILARYSSSGELDSAFAAAAAPVTSGLYGFEGVAIAGSTIVAGGSVAGDYAAAAFGLDGAPVSTFGSGGVTKIDFAGRSDVGRDLALVASGAIILAGRANVGTWSDNYDVGLVRLLAAEADVGAPVTTVSLDPSVPDGQFGWYASTVRVSVSAADDTSGVAETRCVLDPAAEPATFDDLPPGCAYTAEGGAVSSIGSHTVYAASKDVAGNGETPVSVSFKIGYNLLWLAPSKDGSKLGSTIPVRFALAGGTGVRITDAEAETVASASQAAVLFDGSALGYARYDPDDDQFVFTINTPKTTAPGPHTVGVQIYIGGETAVTQTATINLVDK